MKNIFLSLLAIILMPALSFAGIPISEDATAPIKKELVKKEATVVKKGKKLNFFQRKLVKRIVKKYAKNGDTEGVPIFNIIGIVLGFASFASLIAAAFAASMAFVWLAIGLGIAAIVMGIIAFAKKESLKGLGLTGIILGGIMMLIGLLVALIDNSL